MTWNKYWWNNDNIQIISASSGSTHDGPVDQSSERSLVLDDLDNSTISVDLEDTLTRQKAPYRSELSAFLPTIKEEITLDDVATVFGDDPSNGLPSNDVEPALKLDPSETNGCLQLFPPHPQPSSRLALRTADQYWAFRFELERIRDSCTNFPLYYKWVVYSTKANRVQVNTLLETTLDVKNLFKNNSDLFEGDGSMVKIFQLGVSPKRTDPVHKNGLSIDMKIKTDIARETFQQLTTAILNGTLSQYRTVPICGCVLKRKPGYHSISLWLHQIVASENPVIQLGNIQELMESIRDYLGQDLNTIFESCVIVDNNRMSTTDLVI